MHQSTLRTRRRVRLSDCAALQKYNIPYTILSEHIIQAKYAMLSPYSQHDDARVYESTFAFTLRACCAVLMCSKRNGTRALCAIPNINRHTRAFHHDSGRNENGQQRHTEREKSKDRRRICWLMYGYNPHFGVTGVWIRRRNRMTTCRRDRRCVQVQGAKEDAIQRDVDKYI